MGVSMQFG